jgi:hypothetical protein
MTLFRREPRSVYRVYAEDEYLDGEQPPLELDAQGPSPEVQAPEDRGRWSPAALLPAVLIFAVAAAALAAVFTAGRASHHPAAAAAPVPERGNRVEPYRSPRRPAPSPRPAVVHPRARSRPAQRRVAIPAPQPAIADTGPAPVSPRADAQLEFGFER